MGRFELEDMVTLGVGGCRVMESRVAMYGIRTEGRQLDTLSVQYNFTRASLIEA